MKKKCSRSEERKNLNVRKGEIDRAALQPSEKMGEKGMKESS